ncbi:MAG: hypothetical protein ACTSPY_12905 [Candidatus Helarchaeota archaeon]
MTKIKDLTLASKKISLIVKIIDIEPERNVISKKGKKLRIANVKVADETGAIILNAWDDMIDVLNVGEILKIENGYVNEFRNELFLNIGKFGRYSVIDPDSPEANFEVNDTLLHKKEGTGQGKSTFSSKKFIKIKDILKVPKGINIKFKVIRKDEPRGVNTKYGPQTVCEFLIGDDTGCVLLSLWGDDIYEISLNSYFELQGGYTNTFRDVLKLNKGRYGSLKSISREEAGFIEVNETNNLSEML